MCTTCGCSADHHTHAPGAAEDPRHQHMHPHHRREKLAVETEILAANALYASANRALFAEHGILALNLVSSPGSGKTTLLERTLRDLAGRFRSAVIEGDQQTDNDAQRIAATGVPAVQVNTGAGCHLDAHMVGHAIEEFNLPALDLLLIENVGNLVCPAAFDLGERHKVVVLSVTEGEDKPLKYPHIFHAADLMLLNKIDLLPHVEFDVARCREMARRVNPEMTIIEVSARSGAGMDAWYAWLVAELAAVRP